MKRLLTILAFVLLICSVDAQETYRFRTDAQQGLNIENSKATGLSLHYFVNEINIAEVTYGEVQGQEIVMKGSFGSFAEGLPNLPFENHYIAVPKGAEVSVKVKENGVQTLQNIDLLPAAPLQMNGEDKRPALHWDMDVFNKDANFPAENVAIVQTTQIRGLDVVMLSVTPFRYNPIRKTLEVIYDMNIEVSFEGGNGQFGDSRYRNPAWDGILHDLVVNSDMLPEAHYYERLNETVRNEEEGCEYLIITLDNEDFLAWADTLKQFRTKQGILTKVVTTAECGGNGPEAIRDYILDAYNNWTIPPAAVLLFAENHKLVPEFGLQPFLFTSPPSYGEVYTYGSDNPFADMNGDSIPDLAVSRLLAKYPSECQRQVEKLIEYELNPPTDPHYYDHPVITSGYQEDKWFTLTSQIVNSFFSDKLGKHTTNNYMVFSQVEEFPASPDSIWSTATNTSAVLDYYGPNGTNYIPLSIGYLDNWTYMNNPYPLIDAMSEGGFFTFYRDHSNVNTWCCPWFDEDQITLLQNESPTFIFSIGCSTNNFWSNWATCLSETFLADEVGAIGVIGANTVTYSQCNDLLSWGAFDYFWPEFMPTLGSQTTPEFSYPSYALVAGKLFLRHQAFLPYTTEAEKIEKTLNVFSFLGETYLNLYTDVPQPLLVNAPRYQTNDHRQYTFTAEAGAIICLSNEDGIIAVAQATGEPQSIDIPQFAVGDQFTFTATKQNRFRHEQNVTIVSADYPFVYMKSHTLNDQDGNGQVDFGEYVDIDLDLANIGQPALEAGEISLLCDSPYAEILQGTTRYPAMENGDTCTLRKAFRIRLATDVPDQEDIVLSVHIIEGENTHDDLIHVIANAPLIEIGPEFHPMTAEGGPSTHISTEGTSFIAFPVHNVGHSASEYLSAELTVKSPFVNVETASQQCRLEPNERRDLIFELTTNSNTLRGAWLQSRLDVQYGEYHTCLDTIIQYGGIFENFETDTLNRFFIWTNNGPHSWVHCEDDAYEGNRCMLSRADSISTSTLKARLRAPHCGHNCLVSFWYKTTGNEPLYYHSTNNQAQLTSLDWQYAVIPYNGTDASFIWRMMYNENDDQAKVDDICFPPLHTAIAYAGDNLMICEDNPIELFGAYAYDCDSILWATDGDGYFDNDTIANPVYHPENQDLTNGSVTLTLTAYGNDTIVSSTVARFVNEIHLGDILGDSIVNKYSNQVSHYSIENQEDIHYLWQLDPAIAGSIYPHGNEVDILWNLNEGDADVILSVMADNGCSVEPVTKSISLIGYSTLEWHATSFELFPNPTDGKVNLVIDETLRGKAVIEVYNLLGERMMTKKIGKLQQGETLSLDLSRLVSGLYIIKLSSENGSCSKKVSVR